MKTLDEVIETLERIFGYISDSTKNDALHYLKMYRSDKVQYEADRKNWEDDLSKKLRFFDEARNKLIAKYKELDIGTLNEPLTWDELKTMEGKPVWVEALLYKQWAIVAYVGVDYIRFEGVNLYAPECRIYMGEDNGWQAYRKERYEPDQKAN